MLGASRVGNRPSKARAFSSRPPSLSASRSKRELLLTPPLHVTRLLIYNYRHHVRNLESQLSHTFSSLDRTRRRRAARHAFAPRPFTSHFVHCPAPSVRPTRIGAKFGRVWHSLLVVRCVRKECTGPSMAPFVSGESGLSWLRRRRAAVFRFFGPGWSPLLPPGWALIPNSRCNGGECAGRRPA